VEISASLVTQIAFEQALHTLSESAWYEHADESHLEHGGHAGVKWHVQKSEDERSELVECEVGRKDQH